MILGFLIDDIHVQGVIQLTFIEKWRLIPVQWRQWWLTHFQQELSLHGDEEQDCLFHDVTEESIALNEAIAELKWVNLAKAMDRHMAYPEVRNSKWLQVFVCITLMILIHK